MKLFYFTSVLLVGLILSLPQKTNGQNFPYKISADSTGFDGRVFTLPNGNTLLVNEAIVLTSPYYSGYSELILLNANGVEIKKKESEFLTDIHIYSNDSILLYYFNQESEHLCIKLIDSNFETITKDSIAILPEHTNLRRGKLKRHNNEIFYYYTGINSQTGHDFLAVGKINNSMVMEEVFAEAEVIDKMVDDVVINNKNEWLIYGFANSRVYDSSFNYNRMVNYPEWVSWPGFDFNAVWLNNNCLVTGATTSESQIVLTVLNSDFEFQKWLKFPISEGGDVAGMYSNVAKATDTSFYFAGSKNVSTSFFVGANHDTTYFANSYVYVGYYDYKLNPIWEHEIGGDGLYFCYSITQTTDQGCIVAFSKDTTSVGKDPYNWSVFLGIRDLFIYKFNKDGSFVSIYEPDKEGTISVNVYPNPSINELNFEFDDYFINRKIYIITLNGQVVHEQNIFSNKSCVDVSFLDSGFYLYSIVEAGKVIKSGKWIKK